MVSVSTIEAKFRRAKLRSNNLHLWSEVAPKLKNTISIECEINESQKVYVLYFKSFEYYWLVTDKELIIQADHKPEKVNFKDIDQVSIDEQLGSRSKSEIDNITIKLRNGQVITLFTELATWHFVYSIIRYLIPPKQ